MVLASPERWGNCCIRHIGVVLRQGVKNFSRASFMLGSAASVVACGSQSSSMFVPSLQPSVPEMPPTFSTSTAMTVERDGTLLSASLGRNAIAAHSPSGKLLGSLAVGPSFMRATTSSGQRRFLSVSDLALSEWYDLDDGTHVRFTTMNSGKVGAVIVNQAGDRCLVHAGAHGHLYVRGMNNAVRIKLGSLQGYIEPEAAASALPSMLDSQIWHGDDDFTGLRGTYSGELGFRRSSSSFGRHALYSNNPPPPPTSGGGGINGSTPYFGGGGGGGAATTNPKPGPNCDIEFLALAGAILVAGGGALLIGAGCLVAGVITLGLGCAGALLVFGGSFVLAAAAYKAFVRDNCQYLA